MRVSQGLSGEALCRGESFPLDAWSLVEHQGRVRGALAFTKPPIPPEPGDRTCLRVGNLIVLWSSFVSMEQADELTLANIDTSSELVRDADSFESWEDMEREMAAIQRDAEECMTTR